MVRAAAEGARAAGAQINLKEASEATGVDLEQCDALIWGTGNYYGYMHGRLKEWFDRECMHFQKKHKAGKMRPRPYFCCLSASVNAQRLLSIIELLSTGMNLKKAFEPVMSKKNTDEVLAQCYTFGRDLANIDVNEMVDLFVPVPRLVRPRKVEIIPKPVIVMVVPANSDDATKAREITENRFPEYEVRLVSSEELREIYQELLACGKTNLVVAPLAITDDAWYQRVLMTAATGLSVEYAWPLLTNSERLAQVGKVLQDNQPEEVATMVCVTGSEEANPSLLRLLDSYLRRRGGLVLLEHDLKHIVDEIRLSDITRVNLRPLAMTPDSEVTMTLMREFAGTLKEAGIDAQVERGLDYYAQIMAVWLDGVKRACKASGEDTA